MSGPCKRLRQKLERERELALAAKAKADAEAAKAALLAQPPVPRASLWLALAFLLPNLGALACGFVSDDLVEIAGNNYGSHIHSLRHLVQNVWMFCNWERRAGLLHYRPIAESLWTFIWALSGGGKGCEVSGCVEPATFTRTTPILFHAFGLAVGMAAVILLYRFFLTVKILPRTAFIAALLFALFPIHTEATTWIVSSTDPLSTALGLGGLIFYYRHRPLPALLLFALAVLSKESAAAFAALPIAFPRKDWRSRDSLLFGTGSGVIIAGALWVHHAISPIPRVAPGANPIMLVDASHGIFTALWVQCLYVFKTLLPITLSANYSMRQILPVSGLDDWHAWAGIALVMSAAIAALRWREFRAPILAYAILFSATANVLFPIETIMGERLAYAPSLGIALLLAILLARSRHWKVALVAVALVFGARTAIRNLDWLNQERYVVKLVETSPDSMDTQFLLGTLRAIKGDDAGAVEAYDRAIALYQPFSQAYCERAASLEKLGRPAEAAASYHSCAFFRNDVNVVTLRQAP